MSHRPTAHEQVEFESIAFPADRKVLLVAEVAARLRMSKEQVIDLIDGGHLQAVNIGDGGRRYWRVPVEGYKKFVANRHSFNV